MNFKALSLLPVILASSSLANAADANLGKIFDSYNTNSAGSYNSTQGNYLHGGSFQGRVDQHNVDFVRFTPPSISGSCSGIDIFAGSFGLVSGDELVQVARGIAQGAAPYFFNLAMQSICPSCQGIMEEISGTVNELNRFGQNSCQQVWDGISNKHDIEGKLDGMFESIGVQVDAEAGHKDSWLSKFRDSVQGAGFGEASSNASNETRKEIVNGNTIAFALDANKSLLSIPALGLDTKQKSIEFITALVGTTIYSAKNDTSCGAAQAAEEKCYDIHSHDVRLNLDTLYEGAEAYDSLSGGYECDNSKCLSISPVGGTSKVTGLKEFYTNQILGETSTKGIIDKYRFKEQLNNDQLSVLRSSRYPFHMIAKKLKGEAGDQMGRMISQMLARKLVIDVAQQVVSILYTARTAAINDASLSLYKNDIEARIDAFEKELELFIEGTSEDIANEQESTKTLLAQLELMGFSG